MVFTKTASPIVSIGSTQIDVGDHFVTFSGNGQLTSSDSHLLKDLAGQLPYTTIVEYQGEIVVGPTWRVVHQCSFIVAPGWYTNTNSDEDDWQGWGIRKDKWDLAPVGGGKNTSCILCTSIWSKYFVFGYSVSGDSDSEKVLLLSAGSSLPSTLLQFDFLYSANVSISSRLLTSQLWLINCNC
jgi:hypothetical protein